MPSPRLACAVIFATVLLFLSGLHVYWALGGAWGNSVTIPTVEGRRTLTPGPPATFAVAFLLFCAAAIICGEARLFRTGPLAGLFQIGTWCIAAVFVLRTIGDFKTFGLFKKVQGTPFAYWDTHLYSPLCFVLALLAATVGLLVP